MTHPKAQIGVFGGSGFYSLLDNPVECASGHAVRCALRLAHAGVRSWTERGLPSAVTGKHTLPPHMINYRANVWAMKELGVTRIIGPNACGSLQAHVKPGDFVICDQFVDRTWGRKDTFMMAPRPRTSSADLQCRPTMRAVAIEKGRLHHGARARDGVVDPGSPFDPVRIEVVRGAGVGSHQHDAVPGGDLARGAGDLLLQHLDHHRPRRRG